MKKILFIAFISISTLFGFEHLNPDNFKEKIKEGNVIVDFYATWCPPCKVLADSLEDFEKIKPDNIKIYKVNIEDYKEFSITQGVKMLPTLIYYQDGIKVTTEVGIKDVEELKDSAIQHFN